tara:strand:+ start:257 stop:508 length:252 start_codon:yes stop_codon:yes gene_type:complete
MDDKIKEFPIDKANTSDEVLWKCNACNHKITESMEKKEVKGSKVLPMNLGGIAIYVCPNCRTFQLPEEVYDAILKKAESRIIS